MCKIIATISLFAILIQIIQWAFSFSSIGFIFESAFSIGLINITNVFLTKWKTKEESYLISWGLDNNKSLLQKITTFEGP